MRFTNLGPFSLKDITRDAVADVVVNKGTPIIVTEGTPTDTVAGIEFDTSNPRYAVVATKDLKIICAGCFKDGMTMSDTSRCRTCSSFVRHWDNKAGERKMKCNADRSIADVALTCPPVELDLNASICQDNQEGITDDALLTLIHDRGLQEAVIARTEPKKLSKILCARGIHTIRGGRQAALVHELRRQACSNYTEAKYYDQPKKKGQPHASDMVGAQMLECKEETATLIRHSTRGGDWLQTFIAPVRLYKPTNKPTDEDVMEE